MSVLLTADVQELRVICFDLFPFRMGRRSGKVKTLGLSPKEIREASLFTSVNMKTREPIHAKQQKTRHQLL